MALTPPSPLRPGVPLTALVPWTEKIVAYLRAITPRPSATVSVSTTANGTTLSAAPPQSSRAPSADATPTAAFHAMANWNETKKKWVVSMLDGSAQVVSYDVHFLSGGPWEVRQPPPPESKSGSGSGSEDSPERNSLWVWLRWKRGDDSASAGSSSDSDCPGDSWEVRHDDEQPEMDGDLNVPLFRFSVDENGATQIVQFVEGSVYLPWTVNALDVDED